MDLLAHVEGFEWDGGNSHKPLKHSVTAKEAEESFFDSRARIQDDAPHSQTESRWWLWGRTTHGRFLKIAFTVRGRKVRVISARTMNKKERLFYESQ
ncbi:MAG TPA: BrnT family toxin [Verrucomicrobiae bacterium]